MHWPYLPFLLVWALPVIALQWLAGGRYLWRERSLWPWVVLGLCIYFSLADAVAIKAGIWRFDNSSLTGLWLGPVPIEEVLFYLLTATMVVQGFVIAWSAWIERYALVARWRRRLAQFTHRRTHAEMEHLLSAVNTAKPRERRDA
jgi:lycopene cyclase domain-containing protein